MSVDGIVSVVKIKKTKKKNSGYDQPLKTLSRLAFQQETRCCQTGVDHPLRKPKPTNQPSEAPLGFVKDHQ